MPTIHCGLYYNNNDSSLYYITTLLAKAKLILTNLALAKDVNYDHKVHVNLSILYNHKNLIVQRTG